jgi:AcrR family transcriptional regulator
MWHGARALPIRIGIAGRLAYDNRKNVKEIYIMRNLFSKPMRRGYHHGNLRETLIEAARHLIADNGPHGFTLVEAARLAEVSPAAPYRHFPDRAALVREVRNRGFVLFAQHLSRAAASSNPEEGLRRMGDAYLEFAWSEPGYYAAMFEAPDAAAPVPGDGENRSAFDALTMAVTRAMEWRSARRPDEPPLDATAIALQIWALAHGIALLARGRALPLNMNAEGAAKLLQQGAAALLRGHLALGSPGAAPGSPGAASGSTTISAAAT